MDAQIHLGSPCQSCHITTTRGRFCSPACEKAYGDQPYTEIRAYDATEASGSDGAVISSSLPDPRPRSLGW